MKVQDSTIADIAIYGQGAPEFEAALEDTLGRAPRFLLQPALPFSVIVANNSARAIALLGVRFDLVDAHGDEFSVLHYADTLRHAESAALQPGTTRFVCAEPIYTALVIRGGASAATQGRMNLEKLRTMLDVRAVLDCVAFDDGMFMGPDSGGAFQRLALERESEGALLTGLPELETASMIEARLVKVFEESKERTLRAAARTLLEALEAGGRDGVLEAARTYRRRIPLWR